MIPPTLELEHRLLSAGARRVAGIDEVGRGALAGPVSVGVVVLDATCDSVPSGLTDSKLLSARAREALVPVLRPWCVAHAVGHAEAAEIDDLGIVAALRLAALRALALLPEVDAVILDGSHDWLSVQEDLFSPASTPTPVVHMRVKADTTCASVSAASVLAKVERDSIMVRLDEVHPGYDLAGNKGYGSEQHRAAIARLGATDIHRRSWRLT